MMLIHFTPQTNLKQRRPSVSPILKKSISLNEYQDKQDDLLRAMKQKQFDPLKIVTSNHVISKSLTTQLDKLSLIQKAKVVGNHWAKQQKFSPQSLEPIEEHSQDVEEVEIDIDKLRGLDLGGLRNTSKAIFQESFELSSESD